MDINFNDIEAAAAELAGNWYQFSSFVWHNEPDEGGENWAIINYASRDSTLLAQSNAAAIEAAVKDLPDAHTERHNHWAVGWVDNVVVLVYDDDGEITPSFKAVCELFYALEEYPVLDDEDYSQRQWEATLENIEYELRHLGVSDSLAQPVYDWLDTNDQRALEDIDDQGGYPSQLQVATAIHGLLGEDFIHVPGDVIKDLGGRVIKKEWEGVKHEVFIYPDDVAGVLNYLGV